MADRNPEQEAVVAWIAATLPPLLEALEGLEALARNLHPPLLGPLVDALGRPDEALEAQLQAAADVPWPDSLVTVRDRLYGAGATLADAYVEIREAAASDTGALGVFRALRARPLACEQLYPLAPVMLPISRYFVEPDRRTDVGLLGRLSAGGMARTQDVGLMQSSPTAGERGGFSLYVPETYTPETPHPLIMALHGGSGSGRGFLWTWLREARTRGAILVAPTAQGDTWSIMDPGHDGQALLRMLALVVERWNVDPARVLLTGMSDGGTFTTLFGLDASAPFSHLAPISASFHPIMLDMIDRPKLVATPIHLTHGVLDWMFPITMAQEANHALTAAGGTVTYAEVPDLSHTYPAEMNARILDWMGVSS